MSKRNTDKRSKQNARPAPRAKEVRIDDLEAIVARAKEGALTDEEHGTLKDAIGTLSFLTNAIESKDVTLSRLRKMLFGASTESLSNVLGTTEADAAKDDATSAADAMEQELERAASSKSSMPKKGHGRAGADAYTGATRVDVPHSELKSGMACPACPKGTLYATKTPGLLVRVTGMAPLAATVHQLEKLRCGLCGKISTAIAPAGIGSKKYDEGAAAMVALLKYGAGLPFNRIETLQAGLGIPMPSSTQWEIVQAGSRKLLPAYQELVRQAAQGDVLHNDDTTMKILELTGARREDAIKAGDIDENQRVGLFTSGIVSVKEGVEIALFFTGHQHAGENLADVLALRAGDLAPPIQMSDALAQNTCGEFQALLANCLTHARRNFVEVTKNFPEECEFVLRSLAGVYRNDAIAREEALSPAARLEWHQAESGPLMQDLEHWLKAQIEEKLVEPNSGLGKAIKYMRKHWAKLTLFLREPGAPLDNNTCERALKKAIINRKNAYFYKTREGARIGDLYMSLIHTAERCRISPFEYLVALLKHHEAVVAAPDDWMPWNYATALERSASTSTNDAGA
jgi:transposase